MLRRHRRPGYSISVGDLIDHYIKMELSAAAAWHSHASRITHLHVLDHWIRPSWGTLDIHAVRTVEIERWLREQKRMDGTTLANSSRVKIRSVFSVLFNHAMRYEWLEQERHPALYVRQSAKRRRAPGILEPKELQALLTQLESSFRLMVLVPSEFTPRAHDPSGNGRRISFPSRITVAFSPTPRRHLT